MARGSQSISSARQVAVTALADASARFPDLAPTQLELGDLSGPDAALAVAIHRTTLQRWLTLEHLLDPLMSKPCHRLEPAMRAVLLAGAAQLLFMQRLPAYAVVDEAVVLARRLVRPGAAGLANAVLRRFSRLVGAHDPLTAWQPGEDRLPLDGGGVMLREGLLPSVADREAYLAVATSHPLQLVKRWVEQFGLELTQRLCVHSTLAPPTIVAVEQGFDASAGEGSDEAGERLWQAHERPGFVVWRGSRERLVAFLAGHAHRRVQDPTSARAVASCRSLEPRTVLDYCAGRGTKTVQLAAQFPGARVLGCDPHAQRLASLGEAAGRHENVQVLSVEAARQQRVDLLVLDVPCSNTGVLARRPEARYRLSRRAGIDQVVGLVRQIMDAALPTLEAGGHLLFSTCSIEPAENENQVRRLIKRQGMQLVDEARHLPGGGDATYHDGGYHALLCKG